MKRRAVLLLLTCGVAALALWQAAAALLIAEPPAHIKNAIAEFERSLLTPGSRFDRYLEGERDALTRDEREGYRLFKNYGCFACHQGVNVGGNLYEEARGYLLGKPVAAEEIERLLREPYAH